MISHRFVCLSVAAFLLTGCATSPVKRTEARQVDSRQLLADYAFYARPVPHGAKIAVIRDAAKFDGPERAKIFVDGRPVAYLRPGERLDLNVYPGDRIFGVGSTPGFFGAPEIYHSFLLQPGRTYPFRVGIVRGRFDIQRASSLSSNPPK